MQVEGPSDAIRSVFGRSLKRETYLLSKQPCIQYKETYSPSDGIRSVFGRMCTCPMAERARAALKVAPVDACIMVYTHIFKMLVWCVYVCVCVCVQVWECIPSHNLWTLPEKLFSSLFLSLSLCLCIHIYTHTYV